MTDSNLRHCLELLREADPDRYLSCLWLGADWRAPIAALYAFNAEVERIPDRVSEPAPGEIRLQWWREVIGRRRETGDHPVAAALLEAIARHDLPVATFDALLEARIFDLYHDPMPDRPAFEAYAGETSSALLMLAARCAGAPSDTPCLADTCGHGGVAQTVAATLRELALHRHRRRCYLPADMLSAAGLTADAWLDDTPDDRHRAAVAFFAGWGRDHLDKARLALGGVERGLRPVFLPLAPVAALLDGAGRAGADPFERPTGLSPLRRQWLFANAALSGRIPRSSR